MARGHCSDCGELVAIRPSGPGAWKPIPHHTLSRHRGCGGKITQTGEAPADFACSACGGNDLGLIYYDEIECGGPCDGHERTLRSPGYQHGLPADYDGPGKRGPALN